MTKVRYNGSVPSACAEGGEITAAGKGALKDLTKQDSTDSLTRQDKRQKIKVSTTNKTISQSK